MDEMRFMRYYQVLLDALFAKAFESTPLAPGQAWIIPLCSRGLGECRQYPHLHVLYIQNYDGHMGIGAVEMTSEGVQDERTCLSAAT